MNLPQLARKKVWLPLAAAIIIVVVGIAVPLGIAHSNAVSRQRARSAAATYEAAASTYMKTLSKQMNTANTIEGDKKIFAAFDIVKKQQASFPTLAVVKGAGAQLPAYEKAAAYQKKLRGFNASLSAYLTLTNEFRPFDYAYIALNDAQSSITAGQLTAGDPVASIKKVIIDPLTKAQADFKKAAVPAKYKQLAADITTAFNDYIGSGNALIEMYQTNNLHNADYNFVPQLDKIYNDEKPIYTLLNSQGDDLTKQSQALAKQS